MTIFGEVEKLVDDTLEGLQGTAVGLREVDPECLLYHVQEILAVVKNHSAMRDRVAEAVELVVEDLFHNDEISF
jgi:hypothetical protein